MKIGYARVSTNKQDLQLQLDALKAAGCERIYKETVSSRRERPELEKMLDALRPGDVVVAWKLDRLGRNMSELIGRINSLHKNGVDIRFIKDGIDTTTAAGKFTFHLMAALAEFERDQVRERTKAGLDAAKSQGRVGGRPRVLTKTKIAAIRQAYASGVSAKSLAAEFGVAVNTIFNYLKG